MSSIAASRRVETTPDIDSRRGVYLDYHASTPCDPRVVEAMLPHFLDTFANPASSLHYAGRRAADAVERARGRVASAIGAERNEIVFTSGATESNNLAILGSAVGAPGRRRKVLASAVEHKSVLAPCQVLSNRGFEFHSIPVDRDGRLDVEGLASLVDDETFLLSVQAVNNEIGTIQPVVEAVQIAHSAGALVHCDAAQALGRVPVDVGDWGVDLLSLSGHKCYGPKGTGALYVRGGTRSAPLEPLLYGGGQEGQLRPGTHNVPGIVGLGAAAELAEAEREADTRRIKALRDWFEYRVMASVPRARRNGSVTTRVAGSSSITFPGIDAEALIANLRHIHVSTGSACTSGAPEPSHVLLALGLSRDEAFATLRVGFGRFLLENEVRTATDRLIDILAAMSVTGRRDTFSPSPEPPTLDR